MINKTLNLLLSGKHPESKKYAGHHVLVVDNRIFPLKDGIEGVEDLQKLREKYKQDPVITFVPRHDITYILISCKK